MKCFLTTISICLILVANAQTTTVKKVVIPSTETTYYAKNANLNYLNNGDNVLTLTGMISLAEGDEDEPIQIPGSIIDVYTNPNGQTTITCRGNQGVCFEVNTVSNVNTENLVLINEYPSTQVYVAPTISAGVLPTYIQVTLSNASGKGNMSVERFEDIVAIQSTQQGGTILGYVSSVKQIGSSWVVQCDPGPGWCLRYIRVPENSVIFD